MFSQNVNFVNITLLESSELLKNIYQTILFLISFLILITPIINRMYILKKRNYDDRMKYYYYICAKIMSKYFKLESFKISRFCINLHVSPRK